MQIFKRITAIVMVALLIVALVGCGSSKREIVYLTLSTEDSEAILAAAGIRLPAVEETAATGTTVKWFAWYDDFHNYSDDEVINTGFWTFTNRYECEVEWIECTWSERFDNLATLVLSSNSPDMYPGDAETFPYYALVKGMFLAVDDYIDYSDPLWEGMKDFADSYFSVNGQHYMIVTDRSLDYIVGYNRRVIEEWGYDDPAELFYNDQWTTDVFLDMCIDFSDADEERYALDGWYYDIALMFTSGVSIVEYDLDSGLFVSNLDNPGLERAANLIYELKKNDCIYPVWNNGWALRGGEEIQGVGVKEGLTLFFITGLWGITDTVENMGRIWGDMEAGEVMFVPVPRDSSGDGKYYVTTKTSGYCIVIGAENPEGVALLASCDRFKIIDPTVVSIDRKQLEETYLWTDDMLDMYDVVYDLANSDSSLVWYDAGLGTKLYNTAVTFLNLGRQATASTWSQVKESYSEQLAYYVDQFNEEVAEYAVSQ